MHVGALEGRRWAGLVFAAPEGGAGLGMRLRFHSADDTTWDWEDWYWAACDVGPHAPDGSYARVGFDLDEPPSPENRPDRPTLTFEWACLATESALVARVTAQTTGTLEVVGDTPWDWIEEWNRIDPDAWKGTIGSRDLAIAFSTQGAPDELGPVQRIQVGASMPTVWTWVVAWGEEPEHRARALLAEADIRIDASRDAWLARRPAATGEWPELVDRITDHLLWMVLLQPETGARYTPAGRRWIFPRMDRPETTEPDHWTVFGWDSFFNAIELAVASPELAWDALLAGLGSQYPNGNVPNWRGRFGGTPDRSQPPVGAFAALQLHLAHPSASRLRQAWPRLRAWSEWWDGTDRDLSAANASKHRRRGITPHLYAWGSDTGLLSEDVPQWERNASGHQRAAWESGQDDLPLWDGVDWDEQANALRMSAVDLCSYRALDLECLAHIARLLGAAEEGARLEGARERLVRAINRVLWSEEAGLYLDELPKGHSTRVAASNFLPLVAGVPDGERARRMLAVLTDPERFWGRWLLPSVARDDPAFPDQQYWRGSIWPPMNYLVLQGLRRYGFHGEAAELAWHGAAMFLGDARASGMCRENFDARTGEGQGRRFQSWGPLFALGALEDLVRVSPWEGLVVGCARPAASASLRRAGVRRLSVAGHRWDVEPTASGCRFRVDGHSWIDLESGGALAHVTVEGSRLRARCRPDAVLRRMSGADSLVSAGAVPEFRPDAEGWVEIGLTD